MRTVLLRCEAIALPTVAHAVVYDCGVGDRRGVLLFLVYWSVGRRFVGEMGKRNKI
jgi:hypothetical protein